MLTLLSLGASLVLAAPQDPQALSSSIAQVTVFPGSALVQRDAETPSGKGKYIISGMPQSMDPDSIRVRCTGAEVIGLETRERFQRTVPDERVQELRDRIQASERELAGLADERAVLAQINDHLERLVTAKDGAEVGKQAAATSAETWTKNIEYLTAQLTKSRTNLRENGWKTGELQERIEALKVELARGAPTSGVHLRDVIVELDGGTGPARLEFEYIVNSAGWRPMYDLRTAADAKSVDLSYRAQVWQQSGEDWNEVALALSTAEPQRGAQGPGPRAVWLRIREPEVRKVAQLRSLGYTGGDKGDAAVDYEAADAPNAPAAPAPRPFATVESQGLSVRFKIASRETIQSRSEPSTVLVGQSKFDVAPEYYAAPAIDTNVWLRGKAKNTSPWVILGGQAAVYFGADFLGRAQLDPVQPGEEFTLHLGPDPALTIERKQVADLTAGPGIFGSKSSRKQTYRVRIKNNGAAATVGDGMALVWVRDVLPRATDERIKVELSDSTPAVSTDERWKKDREEQGIVTWPVSIARGAEAFLEYTTKIAYPEGTKVLQRN
jgi:uncharacterized protein (TIGR02231 family)